MKSTRTTRVTIATVMFLIVALNSPPSTPSIPTDLSVPPSPEEVKVLEELLDWVRAGRKEDPSGAFSLGDIASAIRERPRSFELFRRANSESDQLRVLATLPFGAEIERAAARYQVDGLLIAAMIKAESSFNPQAVSPVGALGLMQLMPDTADPYGTSDVFDPGTNIRIGTHYISRQLREFDGNLELACAVDRGALVGQPEPGQLRPIGAEGVGLDDVGTSVHVGPVDLDDQLGPSQVERLKRLVHEHAPVVEHAAHGPVADQHPIVKRFKKRHPRNSFNHNTLTAIVGLTP